MRTFSRYSNYLEYIKALSVVALSRQIFEERIWTRVPLLGTITITIITIMRHWSDEIEHNYTYDDWSPFFWLIISIIIIIIKIFLLIKITYFLVCWYPYWSYPRWIVDPVQCFRIQLWTSLHRPPVWSLYITIYLWWCRQQYMFIKYYDKSSSSSSHPSERKIYLEVVNMVGKVVHLNRWMR